MRTPSFNIRDLLAATAIIALTIGIANLAVAYREYRITTLALATPIPLTALIQHRFHLNWRIATGIHYPLAILWAFGFGVAYSFAWRRVPQTFFERDSVGLDYTLKFGIFAMQVMAVAGLLSTASYALLSWIVHCRTISKCTKAGG